MKRTISMILAIVMMLGMFCMTASAENATLANLDIRMLEGASIRVGTVAGIRYSTLINKTQLDELTKNNNTVEIGTIIAPTQYVTDAGAFTMAALDQFRTEKNIKNATYVNVPATVALKTVTVDETEYYVYAGSLENIKDANQTLAFSGIGYVKIGEDVVYATYNNTNSRSVGYVAYRAYMDPDFKAEFGTDGQGLIDDFANAFLTATLGAGAPDISMVRYFEGYNDMANSELMQAGDLLGWYNNMRFGKSFATAIYGKDVKAQYNGGKVVLTFTNNSRDGYDTEDAHGAQIKDTCTNQDFWPTVYTIPGLNNTNLYANGNDTYAIQFTAKLTAKTENGADVPTIGISICSQDSSFARAAIIDSSNTSKTMCFEENGKYSWYNQATATWSQGLTAGSIASLVNFGDGETVTVKYVFNNTMTVQEMWIDCGDGFVKVAEGVLVAGTNQMNATTNGNFDIGLFIGGCGTIEIDNLLVYSYKAEAVA